MDHRIIKSEVQQILSAQVASKNLVSRKSTTLLNKLGEKTIERTTSRIADSVNEAISDFQHRFK